MKKIKKNRFVSWKKYEYGHTFMHQPILLLISGAFSTLLYFFLVALLSQNKDSVLTTVIYNGDLITTKVSPILFWTAIAAASVVVSLLLFSWLLTLIFKRMLREEKKEENEKRNIGTREIRMRVTKWMTMRYLFFILVYLLWLYSSVILSFVIKNGTVLYPLIFLMLTILTFFGKKLFCFPVYTVMKRKQAIEKMRRGEEYLLFKSDEGSIHGNITTKTLTPEKNPVIFSIVENALRSVHASAESVKVVMGENVTVTKLTHKRLAVTVGISALSMMTEEELSARISHVAMQQKSACLDSINRYRSFIGSLRFSMSAWNPLERVYAPLYVFDYPELLEMDSLSAAANDNITALFCEKYGDEALQSNVNAMAKQWVYKSHDFGFDKDFHASLFSNKRPVPDYHKRLMRRYWAYLASSGTKISARIADMKPGEQTMKELRKKKLHGFASGIRPDFQKRPKGIYNEEVKRLSKEFDSAFALCIRESYRSLRRLRYLEPTARIRNFEGERLNGSFKSDAEILSVANDYLTLCMPHAAMSLLSELSEKDSPKARLAEGIARIRLGEKSGVDLVLSACSECPAFAERIYIELFGKLNLILSDEEFENLHRELKARMVERAISKIPASRIWSSDDMKGEYRLTSRCSPSMLSDAEREAVSRDLQRLCGDRLEWAASVSFTSGDKKRELVVVRISELTLGSYTDSYLDGVYMSGLDLLPGEIRSFFESDLCNDGRMTVDVYPDAPIEAFEGIKGAIICHRGKIEAQRFLSHEARSYDSEIEESCILEENESDEE